MESQLLIGGHIYTPSAPDATAMAVANGTIVWVGSDHVGRTLHPDAQVIDLDGALVAPAFVDSHVHLTSAGLALRGLDLSAAVSRDDCLEQIRRYAAEHTDTDLIWGLGWDESTWPDLTCPSTAEVDAVVGNRPVYLARIDEHSAVVSTALRARADGLVGSHGYDEQGPLTADAHHRVRAAARMLLSANGRHRAQRAALDDAAAHGIVAVHENGGPDISGRDDFLSLAHLDHPVEIRRYWGEAVTDSEHARALQAETAAHGLGGDLFIDGAIGSHTALLREPYSDADTHGVCYLDEDTVTTHLRACTAAGIQSGFHVIGDGAMDVVVNAFREVAGEFGGPAMARLGHRIEHAEMITGDQATTLAACGVIASMQPLFDALWGGPGQLYEQRLGPDRGRSLNNFAQLAKAGVGLAFSSDAPVTSMRPWEAIAAAAHHNNPASAISVRAAFAAVTRGAWRAGGHRDGVAGTLVPGAPADYAVWDVDNLVVAGSADPAVARWSTDPRSRVPALPDLSAGSRLPECIRTVRAGVTIYDRAGL
ncbi:hypothetical protein DFJ75_2296 [Williamsia muralis]|uniref:Amidohydrolase 3 domain-containing protein n=1 Tax=Williamsia marianensis TaxID=85044 RepID=A0A495K2K6_WILMA|nr:amidohydrolase [Williamsia muralis]RKR95476.1 hypothetical protein DFJ75_2296 [Williamsia muralis]